MYEHDTIAAIATPPGQGGIAIIRISGARSETVIKTLFLPETPWREQHTHHFYLGRILDKPHGTPIDQGAIIFMRAPKSYTCENTVEVHLHGGNFLTRCVLEAVLCQGVRLAQPGEFTKRAFLNGRLDLAQAEAVLDLIQATNETGLHLAWEHLTGRLSQACDEIRDKLLSLTAHLEALIDFPEEDIPEHSQEEMQNEFSIIRSDLEALEATFSQGKVYRDGVRTAIVGKPNVGKSSLLNLLTGTERAIVTKVPGTTRDIIEETVLVNDIPLVVWDTAGIRHTTDEVEQIGIERALAGIEQAELILAVFDAAQPFDTSDALICEKLRGKKCIPLINKSDLFQELDPADVISRIDKGPLIYISAKYGTGMKDLEERIQNVILGDGGDGGVVLDKKRRAIDKNIVLNYPFITKMRHKSALTKTTQSLKNASSSLKDGLPLDLVAVDLHTSLDHIGEITGHVSSEDILDRVFQDFCIGK